MFAGRLYHYSHFLKTEVLLDCPTSDLEVLAGGLTRYLSARLEGQARGLRYLYSLFLNHRFLEQVDIFRNMLMLELDYVAYSNTHYEKRVRADSGARFIENGALRIFTHRDGLRSRTNVAGYSTCDHHLHPFTEEGKEFLFALTAKDDYFYGVTFVTVLMTQVSLYNYRGTVLTLYCLRDSFAFEVFRTRPHGLGRGEGALTNLLEIRVNRVRHGEYKIGTLGLVSIFSWTGRYLLVVQIILARSITSLCISVRVAVLRPRKGSHLGMVTSYFLVLLIITQGRAKRALLAIGHRLFGKNVNNLTLFNTIDINSYARLSLIWSGARVNVRRLVVVTRNLIIYHGQDHLTRKLGNFRGTSAMVSFLRLGRFFGQRITKVSLQTRKLLFFAVLLWSNYRSCSPFAPR